MRHAGAGNALVAAALFGASTPVAKQLVGSVEPLMLAGMLYLGSGVGLAIWYAAARRGARLREAPLTRTDVPWLIGAVAFGGVLAPVLLLYGLTLTDASTGALLLNFEGVLTAAAAWLLFREHYSRRLMLGMGLIAVGGALLAGSQTAALAGPLGMLAVVAACGAWAIDNNLTRRIAGADAVQIAAIKGLAAGAVNLALALALTAARPSFAAIAAAAIVGLLGYGASLALFVRALRQLGAARTAAYFSTAPFIGVAFAIVWLGETPTAYFWIAAALMLAGVWLHLREQHEHWHSHVGLAHDHAHGHDAHHRHAHDFAWDGGVHSHAHAHEPLTHGHPHTPDLHHRHRH